jgi:hypothetical protein
MGYVLSWRRQKPLDEMKMFQTDELIALLRNNPGIRWKIAVPEDDRPINYLEIGVFKGENIVDMSKSYCKHPDSKMYCVDPWIDYNEYPEYKGKIESVHSIFMETIVKENLQEKIVIHRDFSHNIVPTFENEFFDIAFIDGNHETEFVYKDAIMTFPKVKSEGYLIFDDYDWKKTKIGINKFINEYRSSFKDIIMTDFQLFIQKL